MYAPFGGKEKRGRVSTTRLRGFICWFYVSIKSGVEKHLFLCEIPYVKMSIKVFLKRKVPQQKMNALRTSIPFPRGQNIKQPVK